MKQKILDILNKYPAGLSQVSLLERTGIIDGYSQFITYLNELINEHQIQILKIYQVENSPIPPFSELYFPSKVKLEIIK
jgi:hypothetical protein